MVSEFWCCLVEGSVGFIHKHLTEEDARIEAKRLALLNKGRLVYILKAIGYYQAELPVQPPAVFYPIPD